MLYLCMSMGLRNAYLALDSGSSFSNIVGELRAKSAVNSIIAL